MLITDPDLLNSCRVCRSPNQDGEYECLYTNSQRIQEKPELSEAGILYESLLDIPLNEWDCYPRFLCNSCGLQMRLFKKLKDKAYKTLEYLQNLHAEEYCNTRKGKGESEHIEFLEEQDVHVLLLKKEMDDFETLNIEQEEEHVAGENYLNKTEDNENYTNDMTNMVEELENNEYKEGLSCDRENHIEICAIAKEGQLETNGHHYMEEEQSIEQQENQNLIPTDTEDNSNNQFKEIELLDITESSERTEDKLPEITLELDTNSIIDKNDYVTEIYVTNNETFNENSEIVEDCDLYDETNTETSSVFNDVEYVLDETTDILQEQEEKSNYLELKGLNPAKKIKFNDNKKSTKENNTKKKEYKCGKCQLVLKNTQEYKNHRKEFHNEKYPCSVCCKEMKSLPALHTHMKLHNDQPAYQCEICQKTFNQKSHFQYHMNRHNNVRNFKCSECEKAFLTNSDLKIHMRSHTGQRPYVCNICGKDYLMMEHLKAHAFIHSQEYFQCDICQNKFATHKTLRTHMKTIHEDEPRFKCNYCPKAFRRKHHLEYHLRLHQTNVKFLDNSFELIDPDDPDDPGVCEAMIDYNTDDLIDHELVDEPGFIAL